MKGRYAYLLETLQKNSEKVCSLWKNPSKLITYIGHPRTAISVVSATARDISYPFFDAKLKQPSAEERASLYQNSLAQLCRFAIKNVHIMTIRKFHEHPEIMSYVSQEKSLELKMVFDRYGSDKASTHDYHLIYQPILARLSQTSTLLERLRVFEIGMGTNNPRFQSNMGLYGRPGASLRAFRDFLPHSEIFGADIDKEILFQEDHIKTCWVDQLSLTALDEAFSLNSPYDLVIDDGLHDIEANLNTLSIGISHLKRNGAIVIEDIYPSNENQQIWLAMCSILADSFHVFFLEAQRGMVFVALKKTVPIHS